MKKSIPQFLIAAPSSGSGKTMIARSLIAVMNQRGYVVQPFKCGPDYIDTKYHEMMSGRGSVNLDLFMASSTHVKDMYATYAADADMCVVEGMMGLFDGYNRCAGSSAEVAELLHLPIILVVDAKGCAYSMAALLSGFIHFDSSLNFVGVIFNKVTSAKHYQLLLEVCQDVGIRSLGYVPFCKELVQESRYLGLDYSAEKKNREEVYKWSEEITAHIDLSLLLESTMSPLIAPEQGDVSSKIWNHIAIARNDESFSFIYKEHLDMLYSLAHQITFFNPEEDMPIPSNIDLLYLPGGYPEKHLSTLSSAQRCRISIADYIEKGGKVLAECGGMMYLSKGIVDGDDKIYDMVGVFPFYISNRKSERKLNLGYRTVDIDGMILKGHEFHYTTVAPHLENKGVSVAKVYNAKGEEVATPMYRYKNVWASYTHLYWGEIDLQDLFK